ncbi:MAG TPA: ROK family protein [Candidatus Fimiplasma intestinipullorum]|uniref:ROK family protein n=1 Tax=Candidatus Fimiplasma intestinipullorum TaxID=2840825 RepID=A0A9D1HM65_9FIRM|nr:ROK family protein [Candidatus Fimiplasma intestinipullorum]
MYHLGIDIGGTFIKYALIEGEATIVKKWKKETRLCETPEQFYDYVCADIDHLDEIDLIGVSAPGVIRSDSQVLSKAARTVRIMLGTNVNQEVMKRLNKPTYTMNDAKAAGYCEMRIGNGQHSQSSVYFVIGTGIGGCVCDKNGVIQGVDGIAGEFSSLPAGFDENGKVIGLASLASMDALIHIYNAKVPCERQLKYGTEISQLYLENDPEAVEAMNEWCRNIAMGLHAIVIFYNPEIICLGGGISEEDWFIEKIRATYKEAKFSFPDLVTTKIDRCLFSNDANLLGAVLYAQSQQA